MPLDVLTIGEALVEVMRTDVDQPLHRPAPFIGPYPSGAPFIFAAQCARLGLKTGAIGCVGQDAFGQCLLDQLDADGIIDDGIYQLADHTTGVAFVSYKSDGSRDFVFSLGAGGQLTVDRVKPELFEGLGCFHVMGSTLSMNQNTLAACQYALELAVQNGCKISFDPNLRPELLSVKEARSTFRPFIRAADILIPTEDELILLTGAPTVQEAIDDLLVQRDGRIIAVTMGSKGCELFTKDGSFVFDGFKVEEIDSTGAGDCFDGGLIAGLLRHLSLSDSAQLANACGANAVMVKGPMEGAQNRETIHNFIHNQTE